MDAGYLNPAQDIYPRIAHFNRLLVGKPPDIRRAFFFRTFFRKSLTDINSESPGKRAVFLKGVFTMQRKDCKF